MEEHFNSIKVQLKLDRVGVVGALCHHFNSIKVQLKQTVAGRSVERKQFQFHKGTIKTPELVALLMLLLHFNSIKVQLKRLHSCT